ncbi:hypothetical protein E2P84_42420 [Burkholderia cepacia]|uniref:Uncharacterized protein n=1 Tax=Burkholderia cepacia TaxID=292 RepID=A0AAX2RRX4_BURCE|nr:hypothetical protein [Burkholderia cepacia]TES62180.1 hypothetical protein E2P84_42420 [Burkholderia cepacia]TET01628.1 hypothetical protein E3D36_16465 [Burkholderia cepacia]TEU47486.1 hypothetical protein E3D37_15895 [Burkholderia cepacia]TEU53513.1 hypothetical protein E3D38_12285 [Burkholderia cepacia]TEV02119.1 hypothetical protein E3D40_13215 [Burkholderia cepacia]
MSDDRLAIDLSSLGFRASRWRAFASWERPVSNGRVLSVTGANVEQMDELRDGELDVYLGDERFGSERVYGSWLGQCVEEVVGILVQVENSVPPLRLTSLRGVPFVCRLLTAGDRYGCEARNTVEAVDVPLLAFYDARYRAAAYGQYVGALYPLNEFLDHVGSLQLNDGDRDWTLDASNVSVTQAWARLESERVSADRRWEPLADVRKQLRVREQRTIAVPGAVRAHAPDSALYMGTKDGPARDLRHCEERGSDTQRNDLSI